MALSLSRRLAHTLTLLLAVLLVSAGLSACSKSKGANALDAAYSSERGYPHILATEDGRVVVANATRELRRASWYALVPRTWREGQTKPIIGTGRLVEKDGVLHAVQIANVQSAGLAGLELIAVSEVPELATPKLLQRILSVEDHKLTIASSHRAAIHVGDLYFILTRDRFSDEPRMGELLGAIAQVHEVNETQAVLHIIHANDQVTAGDLAVFAENSPSLAPAELTIYAARFGQDSPAHRDGELPTIMEAMPEFLARYGLGGISVQGLDAYIDPRPWDAALNAEAATPDHEWGVLVFGDIEDGRFLYNATGFGAAPEPDSSVGILAGGLPLAFDEDLSELSEQLVPSFVANGLGMRGDHALAIYILENELRTRTFDSLVRYHLREHLALRYNSLNGAAEALRIMNHDITEATKKNETYPLLNALSIRAHLDSSAGLIAQWVEDSSRFIEVGEGVLPADSLDAERTQLAIALVLNGDTEKAEELATGVIARAKARGDDRLLFSGLLALARVQLSQQQPEAALLVLSELSEAAQAYPVERQVSLRMILAELYSSLEMHQEAMDALIEAFQRFQDVSYYTRAAMLRRSAAIFDRIERDVDAARSVQDAAELFSYLSLTQDAALALGELSARKLNLMVESDRNLALRLIVEAREASLLSSALFLQLGQTLNAAPQLVTIAWIDAQFHQWEGAETNFTHAFELAYNSAAFYEMVEILETHARIRMFAGDEEGAQKLRDEAVIWAEIGGLEREFAPLRPAEVE